MSINTELTALADAIRAKSGTSGKLSISGMTAVVNDIVINSGSDIDLSGVTVTADKMLSGIVAVGATGEKVTGNIPTVTASSDGNKVTVPVGYIASEQSFDVGSDGYDTSAVTVTADTMLAGKIAVGKNGETITGTIPTVTASVSGDKVTVPVGYIATEQTFDVGGSGIDTTTSVPPTAADVRLGKEFFANGEKYTGTMPDAVISTETLDGGDIDTRLTISAGYLENDFTIDYLSSGFKYLPFVTATAEDIREGMVGADNQGNPVYGTLVVGGDTPAVTSGSIFKCTRVARGDDLIITGYRKSEGNNSGKIYEKYSYSFAGEYFIQDPHATGRDRVWICPATTAQIIDGVTYQSVGVKIYFDAEHNYSNPLLPTQQQEGSWKIMNLHGGFFACVKTAEIIDDPTEVSQWEMRCPHVDAWIVPDDIDSPDTNIELTLVDFSMNYRGSDAVKWDGEEFVFTDGTWSANGNTIQNVVATGYTPITGKYYTADTGAYATLFPDEIPGIVADTGIRVVKVTEYTPYSAAYSGVMSVTVSGLTTIEDEDYSVYNGTYNVTPETAKETDWEKRVYKHENSDYTISYYTDGYDAYWWIKDSYENEVFRYYTTEDIPNGTNQWENYDWGYATDITTAPITESVPEVQMTLKGQKAYSYNNDTMQWTFSTSVSDFSGFEFEPRNGQIFLLNNQKLIGNTLGFDPGDMQNNALMYSNYGQDEGTPLEGKAAVYAFKKTIDGVACLEFDAQWANNNINSGAESYLFIKIPTAIKPKTTPLSLAVEMYCAEWGNSGATIAGLCKGYTPGSADRDKDTLQRPLLGIAFCPNHGFEVMTNDSHPGAYPADYKKVYDAYHGKWTLFTINIDGNLMSVYFGDERKIVTSINWSDVDEFNYVYLRPGIIGNNYGRVFVFDRLLGENEIAYQVKKLREISGK